MSYSRDRSSLVCAARGRLFKRVIEANSRHVTMMNVSKWLVSLGLGLVIGGGAPAEIYKWVDADGVTQFSQRKPDTQAPIETITQDGDARTKSTTTDAPNATTGAERISPQVARSEASVKVVLCEGNIGATAVGALAMVLNRSYIGSIPDFVSDNASVFTLDDVYLCIDTIFENLLLHEQIVGCDTCTVSSDAPLAVLLELSGNLVAAFRELNDGGTVEWQKIQSHMEARRPRLEVGIDDLANLLRSVVADARAKERRKIAQEGTP